MFNYDNTWNNKEDDYIICVNGKEINIKTLKAGELEHLYKNNLISYIIIV